MENITDLQSILDTSKNIVITSHRNPDGDAVGSSLALYHYYKNKGHKVDVVFPSEYPDNFSWMKGVNNILIYDIEEEDANPKFLTSDIIFCLDYNSLDRVDKMGKFIANLDKPIAMIDHHLYPDNFAEFLLSDVGASSTCELVYEFIKMQDDLVALDQHIIESLYTGILTDTGSFAYNTTSKLFKIVSDLMERGLNNQKVQELVFNSLKVKNIELLGHCLANRMEILEEYNTGIIHLTKGDYETFDIQRGDTEGIVNFLLKIKTVKFAAFITEQPTIVKLSLRSKGDFSVQEIASKHFKGGGHKNASGGSSFQSLEVTMNKLKNLLPNYKKELAHE